MMGLIHQTLRWIDGGGSLSHGVKITYYTGFMMLVNVCACLFAVMENHRAYCHRMKGATSRSFYTAFYKMSTFPTNLRRKWRDDSAFNSRQLIFLNGLCMLMGRQTSSNWIVVDLPTQEGRKAELIWVAWFTRPQTVTHPSINRARRITIRWSRLTRYR